MQAHIENIPHMPFVIQVLDLLSMQAWERCSKYLTTSGAQTSANQNEGQHSPEIEAQTPLLDYK